MSGNCRPQERQCLETKNIAWSTYGLYFIAIEANEETLTSYFKCCTTSRKWRNSQLFATNSRKIVFMPRLPKDFHLWGWLGKTYWNQSPPFANNPADQTIQLPLVKKFTTKKEKKTHTKKEHPKKRICQFCGISFPSKTKMLHCVISHFRETNSNQKFRETANSRHLTSPSPKNSHSSTHPYTETMSLTLRSGHSSFASGSHDACSADQSKKGLTAHAQFIHQKISYTCHQCVPKAKSMLTEEDDWRTNRF